MRKASCPYNVLPDTAYWRDAVASRSYAEIDPVMSPRFAIGREDKVATAGSCFAQHISRFLQGAGFNYFVPEDLPGCFSPQLREEYNYGTFSARYGNIYTVRQLLQLFRRSYGEFAPIVTHWQEDGFVIDPFRPNIQPRGYLGLADLQADRERHFAGVRQIVEESDVFVFTLGLTEAWEDRRDGAVYPVCPGCAWGEFSGDEVAFHNFEVTEVIADLEEAIGFLNRRNPRLKILLTVSPVPLVATNEPRHVLTSTTYSKSVLRVAAQTIVNRHGFVDYFPSYELITAPASRGRYFGPNMRDVTPEGVQHVMRLFSKHYLGGAASDEAAADTRAARPLQAVSGDDGRDAIDVVCDELLLENDR